jgi:hypothetical protein
MKMYPAGDDMEDPLEQPFSSFSAAECGLSHTREGAVGDMEHQQDEQVAYHQNYLGVQVLVAQ